MAAQGPVACSCKLTYFPIAGACEKVRLTFHMCGKEFEDNRIAFKDWSSLKPSTPYGQIPVLQITYEDGRVHEFAQSGAMVTWVVRNFDTTRKLYPEHDIEKVTLIEEVRGLSEDMYRAWGPSLYMGMGRHQNFGHPEDWPAKDETVKMLREKFLENELPRYCGFLKTHMEKNNGGAADQGFLCGSEVTIADLIWLPQLRYFQAGIADHVMQNIKLRYYYNEFVLDDKCFCCCAVRRSVALLISFVTPAFLIPCRR
ncbi:unnamed protein product, partial [Amoebophrya sp. A25]|eukprot:GSA25T00007311001.1